MIYTQNIYMYCIHYDTACTPRLTRIVVFRQTEARPATSTDVVVLSPGNPKRYLQADVSTPSAFAAKKHD